MPKWCRTAPSTLQKGTAHLPGPSQGGNSEGAGSREGRRRRGGERSPVPARPAAGGSATAGSAPPARPRQVSGRRGREAEVPAPAARLHLPATAPPAPPPPARAAPPCPRHMARALRRLASRRGPVAAGRGEPGRALRAALGDVSLVCGLR